MPTRGYRKGRSDDKEPLSRHLRTRLTQAEHEHLAADARDRCMTQSKYARAVITAHLTGQRTELPHARGPTNDLVRHIARIGNNLNQLAHQANEGRITVGAEEIRSTLATLDALARRL